MNSGARLKSTTWDCRLIRRCSSCRSGCPRWTYISLFPRCCLQKRTGGNLAEILDKLAYVIRERFKLRGKIKAISAHGPHDGHGAELDSLRGGRVHVRS